VEHSRGPFDWVASSYQGVKGSGSKEGGDAREKEVRKNGVEEVFLQECKTGAAGRNVGSYG